MTCFSLFNPNPDKQKTTNYKHQISNKFQIKISKSQIKYRPTVDLLLISPILMIGMSFVQDHKVWNFEFGDCDLFVIWFLGIVIYLVFVICFLR